MSQRQKLKEVIALTAAYYNFNLRPEVLLMYVEDLAEYPESEVITAYQGYRKDPRNRQMPLPAQIIGMLSPELSTDARANETASRIRSAISKFGWPNPDKAREYIGDLGWKIVERTGGWQYVCENHGVDLNPLTFHAQARDTAKGLLESTRLGIFDHPIQIGESLSRDPDMILNDTKKDEILMLIERIKQIGETK